MVPSVVQVGIKQEYLILKSLFFLPDDIVSEILSRLEVKSLLRCKSVCKQWYDIIQDKEFVEMHMKRNTWFHKFNLTGENFNTDGAGKKINYYDTKNGLILEKRFISNMRSLYRIRNPSTKGILDLPDPRERVVLMCMYLSSHTGSYKVVCGYTINVNSEIHFDLLDLGPHGNGRCPNRHLSWRTLGISELCHLNGQKIYRFRMYVSADGILYILKGTRYGSRNPKMICFDLEKEVSTTCSAPQSLLFNSKEFRFMLWNEKPLIFSVQEEELKIWILQDYKKQKWVERGISLPGLRLYPFMKTCLPVLVHDEGEDILCYRFIQSCFVYKLTSKVACWRPKLTFDVAETLVSLKGMQPQKKEA